VGVLAYCRGSHRSDNQQYLLFRLITEKSLDGLMAPIVRRMSN
jgi:hypothetical protein